MHWTPVLVVKVKQALNLTELIISFGNYYTNQIVTDIVNLDFGPQTFPLQLDNKSFIFSYYSIMLKEIIDDS